jgi:hypothetical protein
VNFHLTSIPQGRVKFLRINGVECRPPLAKLVKGRDDGNPVRLLDAERMIEGAGGRSASSASI